ncbi:MAG: alpha/beta fold hydrolase [Negativicutes bacterium]|jgi:dipeptidyl aminopeptidase/acylaminoacyl peptidase
MSKLLNSLKIGGCVIGGLLTVAGALAGLSWHNARKMVSQCEKNRKYPDAHPGDYGMKFEALDLHTEDNVNLHAWFIKGDNGATVILQHGYKMHRAEMLPNAQILNKHGFNLLLIELRNHGYSEGDKITFGYEEMYDIKAGLNYLKRRKDVDYNKIMMIGNSMGAVITLLAATTFPEIIAVVADCPFADLPKQVARGVKKFAPTPALAAPLVGLIRRFAEKIAGFKAEEISPEMIIADISPRPVMLIQGGIDDVVGTHNGDVLMAAAKEPKELWYVPDCGHCEAVELYPEEYEARVVPFLKKAAGII